MRNGESETDGLKGKANGKLEVEFRKEDSRIQVALSGFNGSIASETLPKSKKRLNLLLCRSTASNKQSSISERVMLGVKKEVAGEWLDSNKIKRRQGQQNKCRKSACQFQFSQP